MSRFGVFAVLVLGLVWLPAQDRDPDEYIRILESVDRVAKLQVHRVIDTLEVQRGQRVADLGAGSGLFTRPLSREVGPAGVVYAVDIDAGLLEHIRATASALELTNVVTVLAEPDDPRIPEPVDLILIVDTLHHIQNRGAYLRNLPRYLRSGGRVAIIDFDEYWPPQHETMRYTPAELELWMKSAGLRKSEDYDFLQDNFFVIYRR